MPTLQFALFWGSDSLGPDPGNRNGHFFEARKISKALSKTRNPGGGMAKLLLRNARGWTQAFDPEMDDFRGCGGFSPGTPGCTLSATRDTPCRDPLPATLQRRYSFYARPRITKWLCEVAHKMHFCVAAKATESAQGLRVACGNGAAGWANGARGCVEGGCRKRERYLSQRISSGRCASAGIFFPQRHGRRRHWYGTRATTRVHSVKWDAPHVD